MPRAEEPGQPEPSDGALPPVETRFIELTDVDGSTRWRIDRGFLDSHWRCRWGQGCQGIEDEAAPDLHRGCCSVGAHLADDDEAMTIDALAACLPPEGFQFFDHARDGGVFADDSRRATRVVDGACIFLNRPGFPGGMGCSLHLAAQAEGGDPLDYKPGVCGRLPLRVEHLPEGDQGEVRVELRAWRRDDWGPGGASMAWWCTEAPECFDASEPVVTSLAEPLRRLLGEGNYERLLDELG